LFQYVSAGKLQRIQTMERSRAVKIKKHMLDAAAAMEQAREIVFALDKEDQATLAEPLGDILCRLHFEVLGPVYVRYPDLRPPAEPPTIDTLMRWEDIALPESVSETSLDATIFSALTLRWQKTAMVIGKALDRCKTLELPVDAEMVGVRIRALAEAGRLEGVGDLRKWRHSEVRLNAEERRDS
jgi:hypothetical protein